MRELLVVALTVLVCLVSGCASPLPGGGGAGSGADKPAAPKVAVEFDRTAATEVERARGQLSDNYAQFLEREPLGFDASIIERIGPALAGAWRRATGEMDVWGGSSVQTTVPIVIVGLFLLLLAFFDRQAWRVALGAQARTHTVVWEWLQTWVRIGIVVLGRTAPLALLVLLSYFPVQALFAQAQWSVAFTAMIWLLLGYRAVLSAVSASFAFEGFDVPDYDAKRLEAFARRALRLVFGLLAVVMVAARLDLAADVQSLLVFVYEVSLLAIPTYLLFIKSSVMELFPEPEGNAHTRLHSTVDRYFRVIVVLSALLLALRAAGYVNASTFILVRGYGIFLLIIVIFATGNRVRRWVRERTSGGTSQVDLYKSIDWALRIISILFVTTVGLQLLEVWEPLVTILKIPLVSVGDAAISTFSLTKSAFLFLGAVLFARFVRAILVLRVFPAFGVDLGVGYAVQTLVNYALILIGFFVALVSLGVNFTAMTVVIASLGVGIGFGLQTVTENLISGFILLFGRSVKKGDIVTVGETTGTVDAVGARSVLIRTPDNFDMLIPSKEIVGGRIINWSYKNTLIRHRLPVGVSYGANPREVEEALLEASSRHPRVLKDPAPEVWLHEFGDSAISYRLLVFFDCSLITRDRLNGQLNFIIWDVLHERGIEIPFPQRDLHLKSIDFADELRKPQ